LSFVAFPKSIFSLLFGLAICFFDLFFLINPYNFVGLYIYICYFSLSAFALKLDGYLLTRSRYLHVRILQLNASGFLFFIKMVGDTIIV
jgi:hypothetical protein